MTTRRPSPDEYDADADIEGSFSEAYRAVRERVAAGGPGWTPKPEQPVTVVVDGVAVAKGRPRFVRKTGVAFTPAHVRKYESAARFAASVAMDGRPPLSGPVRLELLIVLPIPTSWSRKRRLAAIGGLIHPTSRPDLDNYIKLCDALNAIVVIDDSQIVEVRARKRYGEAPKLVATIFPLEFLQKPAGETTSVE
jgi:Holliday junction resolvase RusA-like endonuclease